MKRLFALAAAFCALGWAIGPGKAFAAFADLGAGARAPGMGGAFAAVADDVYAIYYNPAGLGLLQRPELGTSYSILYTGLSDNSNLTDSFVGYAQPIKEGDWGALGAGWNSFSLDSSLYEEQSFYLSYGRRVPLHAPGGELYAGGSLKYLRTAFGAPPEASNASDGGLGLSGQADPLLSGRRSRGAADGDLGLLYRYGKHYALGLAALHVNEPDVAVGAADSYRLQPAVKAGLAYHSLVSAATFEVDNQQGATGLRDTIYTAAAERWFPKLFIGDFGLRGALGIGSRQYTQLSLGLSYRTRRFEADYAFQLPINTVATSAGTQRVGLSFRFGRASDEEESLEMVLEAMRSLRAGREPAPYSESKYLPPADRAAVDEYLAQARALELKAQYHAAAERLARALALAPADQSLSKLFGRVNFVAQQIPSLPHYRIDPTHAALHEGLISFFDGDNQAAMEKISEAARLRPSDPDLQAFLAEMERVTGVKRVGVHGKTTSLSYDAARALTSANVAVQDHEYQAAVTFSLQVLKEDPKNVAAWQNLGTAYLALRDYANAARSWRKAYDYETSPSVRSMIKGYLRAIDKFESRQLAAPAPSVPAEPAPSKPGLPADQARALYDSGIDHYTRGEFPQARKAFELILESDPNNDRARKALGRIMEESK